MSIAQSAAHSFFTAAQAPQVKKKPTQQERANRALENSFKPVIERVYMETTPKNAVTGRVYGEKTTELLEAEGHIDPRWLTESQANIGGGEDRHGIKIQSGVKKSERANGVYVSTRIPKDKKKNDDGGSFPVGFILYHISQCWGYRTVSDGGTILD